VPAPLVQKGRRGAWRSREAPSAADVAPRGGKVEGGVRGQHPSDDANEKEKPVSAPTNVGLGEGVGVRVSSIERVPFSLHRERKKKNYLPAPPEKEQKGLVFTPRRRRTMQQ